jgi:hypothetical protein
MAQSVKGVAENGAARYGEVVKGVSAGVAAEGEKHLQRYGGLLRAHAAALPQLLSAFALR